MKDDILKAIMQELELQAGFFNGEKLETIYFGGGTPSVLSADEINRITDTILRLYPADKLKEVTLEANPDDLDTAYVKTLKGTLVDRFSIGIQSFYDEDLLYMNRAHNAQQADRAIKTAQDAGFTNLTIDLIYGTPGLTDEKWKQNLSRVAALDIPHFSAYALTVEEGTALYHNISKKKATPVDAGQSAAQFEILTEKATDMGFLHYEISNLAREGHLAVHNTNYWMGKHYLGIGPSAHSFDGKRRRWNVANNALYIKSLQAEKKIPFEEEILTPVQHLNEYIMTSLRTMWGCDTGKIRNEWGNEYAEQVLAGSTEFAERNWLENKDGKLILTNKGKLFADHIAGELFVEELK